MSEYSSRIFMLRFSISSPAKLTKACRFEQLLLDAHDELQELLGGSTRSVGTAQTAARNTEISEFISGGLASRSGLPSR